ncbi:ferritin-like domain-containing protein [Nocardioides sp.]|uniref:ferritin-like domain-containing protein n=1 Tax=Nocardioides sp. TaxID=35761 RepID=UPI0035B0B16F
MSVLDALQTTLADEHAALYVYGVLGARTSQAAAPQLYDALTTAFRRHRSRRDQLRAMVTEAGGEPVAAAPAYDVELPVQGVERIRAAALAIEVDGVETLLALVAQSSGAVREWALTEATWSATWQLELGGEPQAWPGAPELE